jgi:hypothetical protein
MTRDLLIKRMKMARYYFNHAFAPEALARHRWLGIAGREQDFEVCLCGSAASANSSPVIPRGITTSAKIIPILG